MKQLVAKLVSNGARVVRTNPPLHAVFTAYNPLAAGRQSVLFCGALADDTVDSIDKRHCKLVVFFNPQVELL